MILSANYLKDVGGVNLYNYADCASLTKGDSTTIYFQIIDSSVNKASDDWNPVGRRYMPVQGATLQVSFGNINDANKITRYASQPFSQDPSIWSVNILSTDPIQSGTVEISLVLNENGATKIGKICQPLRVF